MLRSLPNAFLRYDKDITDKLSLSAQIYGEYIYQNRQNEGFNAFGLNPALPSSGAGFTAGNTQEGDPGADGILDAETELALNYVPFVTSTESELALGSLLATLSLDYDGKYGLDASVRRDETSRFPNNPVGYFWAVGGRWNMDEEDFLSDSDWLSTLKVRASYGTTGSQSIGFDFLSRVTASSCRSYFLPRTIRVLYWTDQRSIITVGRKAIFEPWI